MPDRDARFFSDLLSFCRPGPRKIPHSIWFALDKRKEKPSFHARRGLHRATGLKTTAVRVRIDQRIYRNGQRIWREILMCLQVPRSTASTHRLDAVLQAAKRLFAECKPVINERKNSEGRLNFFNTERAVSRQRQKDHGIRTGRATRMGVSRCCFLSHGWAEPGLLGCGKPPKRWKSLDG